MKLSSLFKSGRVALSYELFPPKSEKGEKLLYENVADLMEFSPDFVTCTYGAGGSTQGKTLEIIGEVKKRFGVPVASHLTLVGSTIDQLRKYLRSLSEQGVDYVVALRGDPPQGQTNFQQTDGGLRYANELVALVRREFKDLGILVAGYPETHREAPSPEMDLQNLKRKVDSGADVVVTQLFYDNADFFRFRDRCHAIGISAPIVPGILPVTGLQQIERITNLCGAKLPRPFLEQLSRHDSSEWQFETGVNWAIKQTRELIEAGIPGIHFYVLNQSSATLKILREIKVDSFRGA